MAEDKFNIDNYLYVKPDEIKTAVLEWLAERQAQKRYSKPVDAVFVKKDKSYSYEASRLVHDLINDQELDSEVFYKIEKQLSYNEGAADDAHALITIDYDGDGPVIGLANEILSITKYKNKVVEVELIRDVLEGSDKVSYYIVETRNKDEIKTQVGTKTKAGKFRALGKKGLEKVPKVLLKQLEQYDLGTDEWPGDFEPFVYMKNNPDGKSDRVYVETELDDIVVQIQKKRDDTLYSSVKVVTSGQKNKNKNKEGADATAAADKAARKMAASSVVVHDNLSVEGSASTVVANAVPNTSQYDQAIRTTMNTILKKTGGATDVDSKGTVQQSKGEVLMSQGDEFKVSNWKKTNRQNKLRELLTKIKKTYTQVLNNTKPFADVSYIFGFISQEEVLSEREQLENAKLAKDLGITHQLLLKARYHNMSLIDMYEFNGITFGATDE